MKLKITSHGESQELNLMAGVRLLDVLQNAGIPVNAACGGKGSCHKCRVRVQKGFLGAGLIDQRAFTEEELQQGWRLSCQATCRTALEIMLPQVESLRSKPRLVKKAALASLKNPALACDLGSTGVVIAIGDSSGAIAIEAHALNKQVRYGADVMTRLHSAQTQGVKPLKDSLEQTLRACLQLLKAEVEPTLWETLLKKGIVCAGNSAMTSFLHGWDISTLAVSPFQPLHTTPEAVEFEGTKLFTPPLLAGFVGGDTFACLVTVENQKAQAPWMMVDIGTNTEIVIKTSKGEYFYASAPAGPAFEGGNITHGMRAEPGAISEAHWIDDSWKLQTIGNDKAQGICGSGLMDLLHESVKANLIHRDGLVEDGKIRVTPEISLLADDIREFQLAKSATRTAADLLIERAGEKPQMIYMAGTFAEHLREDSIAGVGLLPKNIPLTKLGNASLNGALIYSGWSEEKKEQFNTTLQKHGHFIELALQDDFQEMFVNNLNF